MLLNRGVLTSFGVGVEGLGVMWPKGEVGVGVGLLVTGEVATLIGGVGESCRLLLLNTLDMLWLCWTMESRAFCQVSCLRGGLCGSIILSAIFMERVGKGDSVMKMGFSRSKASSRSGKSSKSSEPSLHWSPFSEKFDEKFEKDPAEKSFSLWTVSCNVASEKHFSTKLATPSLVASSTFSTLGALLATMSLASTILSRLL